jgi:hypothetical protein
MGRHHLKFLGQVLQRRAAESSRVMAVVKPELFEILQD